MRRLGEDADELFHQLDVGRAEAPEAHVDERSVALRWLERLRRLAYARVEPVPDGRQRPGALVVHLRRVEVEVEKRRFVDELELLQRGRAVLLAERGVLGPERLVQFAVAPAELVPAGTVAGRVAGEGRR